MSSLFYFEMLFWIFSWTIVLLIAAATRFDFLAVLNVFSYQKNATQVYVAKGPMFK